MTNKEKYQYGNVAVRKMADLLGDIWRQNELKPFYNESLDCINKHYHEARGAAVALGEDVSKYPKRIRWQTAGLEIIEGVRRL